MEFDIFMVWFKICIGGVGFCGFLRFQFYGKDFELKVLFKVPKVDKDKKITPLPNSGSYGYFKVDQKMT